VDNQVQVSFDNHPNFENLNREKEKVITPESTKTDDKVIVDIQEKLFLSKAPFPQCLQSKRKKNHCEEILKVFKNVQIKCPNQHPFLEESTRFLLMQVSKRPYHCQEENLCSL